MVQPIGAYLLSLKEKDTAALLKLIYPDLKPKSPDIFCPTDYYSQKKGIDFELKNRNDEYFNYLIEKPKYEKLMDCNIGYYVCTGGNGIYCWDVKKYTDEYNNNLGWHQKLLPETTEFGETKMVMKTISLLDIHYAENLNCLLTYPYHQNRTKDKRFSFDFMIY
jgi:hypothetical protein